MTSFSIVTQSFSPNRGETDHVFLERDPWDDYGFRTQFNASYATATGELIKLGNVKVIQKGLESGRVELPLRFSSLDDEFCSLGQDQSYYETIRQLVDGAGFRILYLLQDIVISSELSERFATERAFEKSLLRTVTRSTIERFRQLLMGQHKRTGFSFGYYPGVAELSQSLEFIVRPESLPPTNVHAIIGRNGVGKTTLLAHMAEAACFGDRARFIHPEIGSFLNRLGNSSPAGMFTNVVGVSFSAFDHFRIPIGEGKDELDTRYDYIGLRSLKDERLKDLSELTAEFQKSVEVCVRSSRLPVWRRAIETLSSDPGFDSLQLYRLANLGREDFEGFCKDLYLQASAGHRLVLITIARLVETVAERTLVLFDEPEAHLHPPLLGSFVRAISELLLDRNGVAILATHSPVVLQELPRSCVLILSREGETLTASNPILETFGESIGMLTHEVFGLEVRRSGHHALISSIIKRMGPDASYESVIDQFNNQLGTEATSVVFALLAKKEI